MARRRAHLKRGSHEIARQFQFPCNGLLVLPLEREAPNEQGRVGGASSGLVDSKQGNGGLFCALNCIAARQSAKLGRLMPTRSIIILVLAIVALVGLWGGCARTPPTWADSGIPNELITTTALLETAGAPQGINVGSSYGGGSGGERATESSRDFQFSVTSGSVSQLLEAFQGEVRRKIEAMGGKIHSSEVGSDGNQVRAFHFGYGWAGNMGIVRVRSFVGNNGQPEISLFCYEHRR